jgi:FkbM family methyltransferase
MRRPSLSTLLALALLLVLVGLGSAYAGAKLGMQYERNRLCCDTPRARNVWLSIRELLGLATFYSQIGQDKWVLETVFPGVKDGFFLDVGSAEGTHLSNTKALEQKGWTGICIDPFPSQMEGRTCRMLKEVVFSAADKRVSFKASAALGGIVDTLGVWKDKTAEAATVEFTTTTLRDILARNSAPRFIHFVSLDIEGAELEALEAFPFDTHKIGALAVEHNHEEPKRTQIEALMKSHGYERVHSWEQDDFYVPAGSR